MAFRKITFPDVYRRNAQLYGDRTAFLFEGQRVTHREYLLRVERLAAGLAVSGVSAGDRIAVLSQNSLEMIDLIGAVARLGAILLPVNFRLSTEEIEYVLRDATPGIVIVGNDYKEVIASILPSLPFAKQCFATGQQSRSDQFEPFGVLSEIDAGVSFEREIDPDAGFVIIHTAAVGGKPRGALLSQTNLLTAQSSLLQCWNLNEFDINFGALPLFHIAGLGLLLATQQAGGASVVAASFDPVRAVRDIVSKKITVLCEFAPMLANLMAEAKHGELATLRMVTGLDTPECIERFESEYRSATFWSTFGQTETSGLTTLSPYRDRPRSAGRPLFWRILAVVDTADALCPAGTVGEIVVRGPTVFQGYWNNENATSFTLRNGWHHTGDMGYIDPEGYLWYSGRAPEKELIKTGGENVYPTEVENVIRCHPAVAEVVVIGVPDQQWGEAIKAICILHSGATATKDEIISFVAGQIARYKKPKHLIFVATLPRDQRGEIDRVAVKREQGEV